MKSFKALLLILALLLATLVPTASATGALETKALNSAGLLYGHKDAETHFLCSTFTFDHQGNKYEIGTASHCVSDPDLPAGITFTIKFDENSKKEYAAKIIAVGGEDSPAGDVAVLEIQTDDQLLVTPLSDEEVQVGDQVLYAGAADALGKQLYYGTVSKPKLDLHQYEGGNGAPGGWNNVMLLQIAGGPGASGSGIISTKTGKIVGILVGYPGRGQGIIIAVRISQLRLLVFNCRKNNALVGGTCGEPLRGTNQTESLKVLLERILLDLLP